MSAAAAIIGGLNLLLLGWFKLDMDRRFGRIEARLAQIEDRLAQITSNTHTEEREP